MGGVDEKGEKEIMDGLILEKYLLTAHPKTL
jgi:hypothetical protein